MIVDSHCHLDYDNLFNQLDEVVKRAELNKIKYMLTICTTLESFKRIKIIINKYKNIYGTFGIHPHESKNFRKIDHQYIINLYNKNKKIIGIGETGLDYYYNYSDKNIQKESFIHHINAAKKLNIQVFNTPDGPIESVSELVLGIIITLNRNILTLDKLMKEGIWQKNISKQLSETNILIIG